MRPWVPGQSVGIAAGTEAVRPSASRRGPGWAQADAPPRLGSAPASGGVHRGRAATCPLGKST